MINALKGRGLTGLLMLLFVCTMVVANVLTPDKSFSESENRVLEQRPDFSLHSLLSGQYISDYESYTSDQFAFRETWIGAKTDVDLVLGQKDSNGVFLGKEGYLIEQYLSPPDAGVEERVGAIQDFHQVTLDVQKYVMLSPTAAELLSNKLPAYAPIGDQGADLDRIQALIPQEIRFVDVYSALDIRSDQPIFYKTDHHWTTHGAYYAYRELSKQMGIVPQEEDAFDIRQMTDAFYGSLYSKSGFHRLEPDTMDLYFPKNNAPLEIQYLEEGRVSDSLYELDNLHNKDKYTVFLNGNHDLIRIKTGEHVDKKLLVVKDSYANSLIPFLTKHYGEIDVVDLRYYEEPLLNLVKERQYQDMLILYNLKTFYEDRSILNLTEGVQ